MPLSEKLKKARTILGKSQREMAKVVGKSFRSWQTYEDGSSTPGGKVFLELSKLGFNVSWFFTDSVPMMLNDHSMAPTSAIHAIDEQLLVSVIEAIEEYLAQSNRTLSPSKKAQLVLALYDMFVESEEKKVNKAIVIRLAKLAA